MDPLQTACSPPENERIETEIIGLEVMAPIYAQKDERTDPISRSSSLCEGAPKRKKTVSIVTDNLENERLRRPEISRKPGTSQITSASQLFPREATVSPPSRSHRTTQSTVDDSRPTVTLSQLLTCLSRPQGLMVLSATGQRSGRLKLVRERPHKLVTIAPNPATDMSGFPPLAAEPLSWNAACNATSSMVPAFPLPFLGKAVVHQDGAAQLCLPPKLPIPSNPHQQMFSYPMEKEEAVLPCIPVVDSALAGMEPAADDSVALQEPSAVSPVRKRCRCASSSCVKLYCDCFKSGMLCDELCRCKNCSNLDEGDEIRAAAVSAILHRNPNAFEPKVLPPSEDTDGSGRGHVVGCKCRNSACRKKYCECFVAGVACGSRCGCKGCQNQKNDRDEHQERNQPQQNTSGRASGHRKRKRHASDTTQLGAIELQSAPESPTPTEEQIRDGITFDSVGKTTTIYCTNFTVPHGRTTAVTECRSRRGDSVPLHLDP